VQVPFSISSSDLAIRCLCSTIQTAKESLPSHQEDSHSKEDPDQVNTALGKRSGMDDCTEQPLEESKKPKMSSKYVRKFAWNESWDSELDLLSPCVCYSVEAVY